MFTYHRSLVRHAEARAPRWLCWLADGEQSCYDAVVRKLRTVMFGMASYGSDLKDDNEVCIGLHGGTR